MGGAKKTFFNLGFSCGGGSFWKGDILTDPPVSTLNMFTHVICLQTPYSWANMSPHPNQGRLKPPLCWSNIRINARLYGLFGCPSAFWGSNWWIFWNLFCLFYFFLLIFAIFSLKRPESEEFWYLKGGSCMRNRHKNPPQFFLVPALVDSDLV